MAGLFAWSNKKIKQLTWIDIKLIKIATAAATLMIAKLWAPLLSLDWYWYAIIAILALYKPYSVIFRK